jgi:twitching motility protein PilT
MAQIDQFLKALVEREGSDLHLTTGAPPVMRVHGRLQPVKFRELTRRDMEALLYEILEEEARARLLEEGHADVPYALDGVGRFRVSAFVQHRGLGAVVRATPDGVPTADDLELPRAVRGLVEARAGLVLVSGPPGSGRTTTLAALVDLINRTRRDHVLTVEDPVEYVHRGRESLVNQREVGTGVRSVPAALRAALREDPDVLVVGELTGAEAVELVVSAACGGRLVLAALRAGSVEETVEEVLESVGVERRARVRERLARSLLGVVCQRLVPTADGGGRIAVREVMVGTPAVAARIREGRLRHLSILVQTGRREGMQHLDQHLLELLMAGRISREAARAAARNRGTFERYLDTEPGAHRA